MMLDPTEFGSQRTILPRNFALCFCSIVCWIFCLASTARADAPTFEQLSQLPADSQEFAKPIELTATIVFIYPQWHVGIVTDGTGSAILEFGSERNKNRFKVGDKVTLSGNIAKAPTRLTIKMLKAEKVGKGILPTAVEAPEILDAKVLANLDLEFVRVNGRLTHISHHYDRVQIRLDAYGHDIYLEGTARAGQPIF